MSASLALFSTVIAPLCLVGAALTTPSFADVGSTPVQIPADLGSFEVFGLVPTNEVTFAHPEVRNSENWYIRQVELNGEPLFEDVDYTVVDEGSNKGVVIFLVPLQLGDQIRITGSTFESGVHRGTIGFF
jgi:hypothetical protein